MVTALEAVEAEHDYHVVVEGCLCPGGGVLGMLTFEEQIGAVSLALLVLAVWFVIIGYLGSSIGVLPHGVRMGLLAATYVGYPFWAFWLGRRLLRVAGEPVSGPVVIAERHLATTDD